MFSAYDIDQKRARKGLALPQAWHAGDVSASPEQGEACELAGVTRARQPGLFAHARMHACTHEHMQNIFGAVVLHLAGMRNPVVVAVKVQRSVLPDASTDDAAAVRTVSTPATLMNYVVVVPYDQKVCIYACE
jgi:hypothetical protein